MIQTRAYHQARFDVAVAEGADRVFYVLVPDGLLADAVKWAEKTAGRTQSTVVVVSGMDWNKDMSPWKADGVMKREKEFEGGAQMYLKELVSDYVPYIEQMYRLSVAKRYLIGVSLSGLFTMWTLGKTNVFSGLGSISGSLWFDGFTDWLAKVPAFPEVKVYISLGVKEKNTADRRMATVEDRTRETVALLESRNVDVTFEMVSGTHFSPILPKFDKAVDSLLAGAPAEETA